MWNLAENSDYRNIYESAEESDSGSRMLQGVLAEKTVGCFNNFGWQGVGVDQVHSLYQNSEIVGHAGEYCME